MCSCPFRNIYETALTLFSWELWFKQIQKNKKINFFAIGFWILFIKVKIAPKLNPAKAKILF